MASSYRIVPARKRHWLPLAIILGAGAAVVAFWPNQAQTPGYRALCEAQGGIVVYTSDGRLCLWAGAVIPVTP